MTAIESPQKLIKQIPDWVWIIIACLISTGGYLFASHLVYRTGYPLDDAWIHQTYARNLGWYFEWSFLRGVPSAGSTSPLWTFLLALGYAIKIPPYIWTMLMGVAGLFVTAIAGQALYTENVTMTHFKLPWVALFLAFEWHLVWASASGMETGIYAGLIICFFYYLSRVKKNWFVVGAIAGGLVWLRPDAVTLMGPALFVCVLHGSSWKGKWKDVQNTITGFLLGFIPYLGFNYLLSGSLWPNTFYAKQAEYAILYQTPLITRLVKLMSLPLVGAGVLLAPGFIAVLISSVKNKKPFYLAGCLWWLGYTFIYAARLPVTYQHGRYLIPAMGIFFVLSILGIQEIKSLIQLPEKGTWLLTTFWKFSLTAVLIVFWVVGAKAYGEDVAIIETEMVETAYWLNTHTEPQAMIAVHDIGAIGYFSDRKLLDLAGLISPEVVPFIRDEQKLADFMDTAGVDYLVTFPNWYPYMTGRAEKIFQTQSMFSPLAGGENMAIYRWNPATKE